MLAAKVEDMLNTVVRQIAFYKFERLIHLERRSGELTADRISELWMSVQAESLGPAIELKPGYETYWAYIGHFIHSPFYVYAYAFGDCLVNSLYGLYERSREGFAERYLAMLAAGGSKSYSELLAALRPRRERPGLLEDRLVGDRAYDRRARGDGVGREAHGRLRGAGMDGASVQKASDMLARCWREGRVIDALPSPLRPSSRAGGYAIQAKVEAMSEKPLFGWKIAATSVAGQKHIGVDGPLAGRLLAERVYGDDDEIRLGANRMRVAECEFAFRMGRNLPPRDTPYEREDVLDAVADLHLAIEVPELALRRLRDGRRTADHRRQRLRSPFCLGPRAPAVWRKLDLAAHRVVAKVGPRYDREGIGANVLGHPLIALTWIANELSALGVSLASGQVVTTGTCVTPLEIEAGDEVSVDYGVLGQVRCRFAA